MNIHQRRAAGAAVMSFAAPDHLAGYDAVLCPDGQLRHPITGALRSFQGAGALDVTKPNANPELLLDPEARSERLAEQEIERQREEARQHQEKEARERQRRLKHKLRNALTSGKLSERRRMPPARP